MTDRHRVRDLLDHQGDHRHGGAATRRGRQARPRRAGEKLSCPISASCRLSKASTPTASRGSAPPKREITTRMLLLHTAGMGYDFFNADYNRLAQERGPAQHCHRVARRR